MEKFLNALERKFGRYAVPDLIKYVVIIYCAGAVIGLVNPYFYYQYLSLNMNAVFHGQIWRLFTFLLEPSGFSSGSSMGGFLIGIIFFLFQVNLFFLFGRSLEAAWGTFRFNMYIVSGFLFNIIAALILYLSPLHVSNYDSGMQYIYWSMFFAFALMNPDMEFLLYAVLPIKVKWLALLDAVYMVYQIINSLYLGFRTLAQGASAIYTTTAGAYFSIAIAIIVAMANFLIYFFATRQSPRARMQQKRRKRSFERQTNQYANGARHRCAVCGRTELDDDSLDFRYCSKCDGNYEYCSDHLFTHQHVKKFM